MGAENTITSRQFGSYLYSSVLGMAILNSPALLIAVLGRMSWLGILALFVAYTLILLAILACQGRTSYVGPGTVFSFLLGRRAAKVCLTLVCLWLMALAALYLRVYTYVIHSVFLNETPFLVLGLLLFLPTLYTALCELRVYGHTTSLVYSITLVFFLIFFAVVGNYRISYVFPLWEPEVLGNFVNLPLLAFGSSALVGAFFILPQVKDVSRVKRETLIALVGGVVILLAIFWSCLSFFGIEVLSELLIPFYNMSNAYNGSVLERLDIIYLACLLPALTLLVSFHFITGLWAGLPALARKGRAPSRRYVLVFGLLVLLLAVETLWGFPLWEAVMWSNAVNLGLCLVLLALYLLALAKMRRVKS